MESDLSHDARRGSTMDKQTVSVSSRALFSARTRTRRHLSLNAGNRPVKMETPGCLQGAAGGKVDRISNFLLLPGASCVEASSPGTAVETNSSREC